MEDNITLIIGTTGAAMALAGFMLNQLDIWKNSDFKYDLLNFVASALLFMYALILESVPFLILNFIWGAVAFKDVVKYLLRKYKL